MRGTTIVWGDYGLRLVSHDRRISDKQFKVAEDAMRKRLRGEKFRVFTRVHTNIGVCVKGNDVRMGKGKGSWDHWATRLSYGRVVFELRGTMHEVVAKDAMRLAGVKLPGLYPFSLFIPFLLFRSSAISHSSRIVEG